MKYNFFFQREKKKISEILMLGNSVKNYSSEEYMNIIPSTVFPLQRNGRFWSPKIVKITPACVSLAPSNLDIPNNTMKSFKYSCLIP